MHGFRWPRIVVATLALACAGGETDATRDFDRDGFSVEDGDRDDKDPQSSPAQ